MEEGENQESLFLSEENADLESLSDDEMELSPPDEENKAKQLNVGNIVMVIGIAFALIVMLVVAVARINGRKKADGSELNKAGNKYVPEISLKEKELPQIFEDEIDERPPTRREEKNVDEVLKDLPEEFRQPEPGKAPVSTMSGSNYKSSRPDTRNSNSIRKIEGLAGKEYQSVADANNKSIIANAMSGYTRANGAAGGTGGMSKEEYISQLMKQSSQIGQASYGSYGAQGNQNQAAFAQGNRESFFNSSGGQAGSGQYLSYASLWDGTIISGALVTAINTDNPGVVIARVTENVYSSYDHSFLLIPEGSLMYATYNSSVSYGQNKVQVAWNLLIRPDGYRIALGNMNGVNAQGESGYKGKVSNHPWETLKALGMIAIYSMIQTEITNDVKTQNNEYLQNAMTDVYTQAAKIGNKVIDRALDIKPTIKIKAGTEIKLITNTPLELPPVRVNQVNRKYVRTR